MNMAAKMLSKSKNAVTNVANKAQIHLEFAKAKELLKKQAGSLAESMHRIKDKYSAGFWDFVNNPSPETLMEHPEYLAMVMSLMTAVRHPGRAVMRLMIADAVGQATQHAKEGATNMARTAAAQQIEAESGGLIPQGMAGEVVKHMDMKDMMNVMKMVKTVS